MIRKRGHRLPFQNNMRDIHAFILRFQEVCQDVEASHPNTGTSTITAVRAEQIDADPEARLLSAFPK